MQFPAWARWAVAVVFIALVLQVAAFVLVHAPQWGLADMLAQAAIWTTVLFIALRIRPNAMAALR